MRALIAIAILAAAQVALAAEPEPPIQPDRKASAHRRWGYVVMATGTRIDGLVSTTTGKPIRIFDRKKNTFRDIKWVKIERIAQSPDEAWLEREWRWKEGGNDEKVYTDRYYRAVKYLTTITLKSGEKIVGDAVAPIYIRGMKTLHRLELHKRFKSDQPAKKDELAPLEYIKELVLTDKPPEEKKEDGVKGETGKGANGEEEKK